MNEKFGAVAKKATEAYPQQKKFTASFNAEIESLVNKAKNMMESMQKKSKKRSIKLQNSLKEKE